MRLPGRLALVCRHWGEVPQGVSQGTQGQRSGSSTGGEQSQMPPQSTCKHLRGQNSHAWGHPRAPPSPLCPATHGVPREETAITSTPPRSEHHSWKPPQWRPSWCKGPHPGGLYCVVSAMGVTTAETTGVGNTQVNTMGMGWSPPWPRPPHLRLLGWRPPWDRATHHPQHVPLPSPCRHHSQQPRAHDSQISAPSFK